MYRVNVLENVINRQIREQKYDRVDVYRKHDKPALKNILYFRWRSFMSNNDVFFEEIQKGADFCF